MLTFISFIEIPLSAVLSTTCLIKLIHLFHIKPRRPVLQSFTHGALPLCINDLLSQASNSGSEVCHSNKAAINKVHCINTQYIAVFGEKRLT